MFTYKTTIASHSIGKIGEKDTLDDVLRGGMVAGGGSKLRL